MLMKYKIKSLVGLLLLLLAQILHILFELRTAVVGFVLQLNVLSQRGLSSVPLVAAFNWAFEGPDYFTGVPSMPLLFILSIFFLHRLEIINM